MSRWAVLPSEFEELSSRLNFVQKKNRTDFTSSCPNCGGDAHPDGEWPDRFILLTESKTTGGPFAFCRHCSYKWWPGKDAGREITPEQRERWRQESEERARAEHEAAERRYKQVLEMLETDRLWERYYDNVTDVERRFFEARGIDETWRAIWLLGWNPDLTVYYRLKGEGEEESKVISHHTPSITIPVFKPFEQVPYNIHNRLIHPPRPGDRYRVQFKDLEPYPFLAAPEVGFDVDLIIVAEGEFKAMNVYKTLADPKIQVIGVSGKNSWSSIIGQLVGHSPFILLDPDAQDQAVQMAKQVGGGQVVQSPMKIDDAILAGLVDRIGLRRLLASARRIK